MPSEHKTNETIKYKLATAMKECMKSASVEKITVTEIVETCGVTRQTFYRNFKDKYDLINWYFDKILLESFEHMGEGKTVYEGLVNKFHYIQQEKLFFKAAFKNDDQNCLRDHDFQLICAFYTEQLETRMACRLSRQLQFQLEMYCQGSIYMTVQWVLGYRKCSAEELAHALASAMPEELPCGAVADAEKLIVKCGDGFGLQLLEVQPEGKKRMKAADFLRGKSIPYGTVLGKVEQK